MPGNSRGLTGVWALNWHPTGTQSEPPRRERKGAAAPRRLAGLLCRPTAAFGFATNCSFGVSPFYLVPRRIGCGGRPIQAALVGEDHDLTRTRSPSFIRMRL